MVFRFMRLLRSCFLGYEPKSLIRPGSGRIYFVPAQKVNASVQNLRTDVPRTRPPGATCRSAIAGRRIGVPEWRQPRDALPGRRAGLARRIIRPSCWQPSARGPFSCCSLGYLARGAYCAVERDSAALAAFAVTLLVLLVVTSIKGRFRIAWRLLVGAAGAWAVIMVAARGAPPVPLMLPPVLIPMRDRLAVRPHAAARAHAADRTPGAR